VIDRRPAKNPLLAIVLLAIGVRAAAMLYGHGGFEDPDNYLPLARSLASGEGFALRGHPTAYRPPLYPILLAPLIPIFGHEPRLGVALLHLALGGATVWLTAAAARGFGLSANRQTLAAFIVAFDPVLVWQSRAVMTETLAALLVSLTLAGMSRSGWWGVAVGGLGSGLLALCRPSGLAAAGLVVVAALLVPPGSWKVRLIRSGLFAMLVVACLLPWLIRNVSVFAEPIWGTTHSGYTLALANNPTYYHEVLDGPSGAVWTGTDEWRWWDSVNRATAGMAEPEADRYLRDSVVRLACNRPRDFARAVAHRLIHFWGLFPSGAVYSWWMRCATLAWTLPLFIALALGLLRSETWRWPRVAAPLFCAGFTFVHTLYWTDMRMRAPLLPAIAVVAASAHWFERLAQQPPVS
jgi:4-amino-4-deoxy-L-arabinose transferase-like glycosyltransferase